MKKHIFAIFVGLFATVATASPAPSASDYILTPPVNLGQKLWIDFSFDPSSYSPDLANEMSMANSLMLNLGGVGMAKGSASSLFVGTQYLGTASYIGYGSGPASGLFASDGLGFSPGYFWSTQVGASGLHSILTGAQHGLLEVTPLLGGMQWSGWGPHATVLSAPYALQDIFPIATISSMSVVDVGAAVMAIPEPETYAMIMAGLGILGLTVRRRKAKQQ